VEISQTLSLVCEVQGSASQITKELAKELAKIDTYNHDKLQKLTAWTFLVYNPLHGFFLLPGHLGGFIERCS
jgi:hypothetical protein